MTGQFDASKHPRAATGEFTTKHLDEADLGDIDLTGGASPEAAAARETFKAHTTLDPVNGQRYSTTYEDFQAAEAARRRAITPVAYADLSPDTRFVVTEGDRQIEYRTIAAPTAFTDRPGTVQRYVDVHDMSRGGSRLLRFDDGQIAETIPDQHHLRDGREVTEADLSRAYGN